MLREDPSWVTVSQLRSGDVTVGDARAGELRRAHGGDPEQRRCRQMLSSPRQRGRRGAVRVSVQRCAQCALPRQQTAWLRRSALPATSARGHSCPSAPAGRHVWPSSTAALRFPAIHSGAGFACGQGAASWPSLSPLPSCPLPVSPRDHSPASNGVRSSLLRL